jgi:hypothetical protein
MADRFEASSERIQTATATAATREQVPAQEISTESLDDLDVQLIRR